MNLTATAARWVCLPFALVAVAFSLPYFLAIDRWNGWRDNLTVKGPTWQQSSQPMGA